jgi:hypothetical protein
MVGAADGQPLLHRPTRPPARRSARGTPWESFHRIADRGTIVGGWVGPSPSSPAASPARTPPWHCPATGSTGRWSWWPPAPQFSLGKSFPGFGPDRAGGRHAGRTLPPGRPGAGVPPQRRGAPEGADVEDDLLRARAGSASLGGCHAPPRRPHLHGHAGRCRRQPDAGPTEIDATQALIGTLAHPDRLFRPFGAGGIIDARLLSPEALRHLEQGGFTSPRSAPSSAARPRPTSSGGWPATAAARTRGGRGRLPIGGRGACDGL